MCLAIIAHRILPQWPLFIAANREERYDRPSGPPEVITEGAVRTLSPRDRQAGGTWIGINSHGLAALITNRADIPSPAPPGVRSRGLLVRELLTSGGLPAALETFEALRGEEWAPFNLVIADRSRLLAVGHEGGRPASLAELPRGLHVVSSLGVIDDRRIGEIARGFSEWGDGGADPWKRAGQILALSDTADNFPPIFKSGNGEGTVSSSILGWSSEGDTRLGFRTREEDRYRWWSLSGLDAESTGR